MTFRDIRARALIALGSVRSLWALPPHGSLVPSSLGQSTVRSHCPPVSRLRWSRFRGRGMPSPVGGSIKAPTLPSFFFSTLYALTARPFFLGRSCLWVTAFLF